MVLLPKKVNDKLHFIMTIELHITIGPKIKRVMNIQLKFPQRFVQLLKHIGGDPSATFPCKENVLFIVYDSLKSKKFEG